MTSQPPMNKMLKLTLSVTLISGKQLTEVTLHPDQNLNLLTGAIFKGHLKIME